VLKGSTNSASATQGHRCFISGRWNKEIWLDNGINGINGRKYSDLSKVFTAKALRWIGAKVGFFALRSGVTNDAGYADIDWFRINKAGK
jgi:hypothetical protein